MHAPHPLTRRNFLAATSCFGAAALLDFGCLPALAQGVAQDPRVAATPLLDKGFSAVRKVGDGIYASVADVSKGLEAMCNGGFIVGKDAALIVEGCRTPAGAAASLEALRLVSQVPVRAAVDTHYHFDHTLGNSFFGAQNIPVWAHPKTASLMVQNYANVQGTDTAPALAPLEKAVRDATDPVQKQRAEGDLDAMKMILGTIAASSVTLPNHPLDPAKLPMTVDLNGVRVVLEHHAGHTTTDIILRVPEQNITFAGDLLFNGIVPVSFDANLPAWRKTMQVFAGYGKDALFVPGHGQVCGQDGIAVQTAIFDNLAEHAEKMLKAGVTANEAQRRYVIPEKFKGIGVFSWAFSVTPAINQFYAEFQKAKR